ncbi:LacI family DNA-binding transcriptional regulator [Actinoplanes sp. NPDC051861]|uniref:LacI family DNA-binding transcriptional regulator n=1 Tax=Actinoplanes sp. NPDC051861 TaxID=3155170 RepID=UPI003429CBDF
MSGKRPTLADVAAAAHVSTAAVSRVINDGPGVSPETRLHVQQVIARLGYRPDPAARALAFGHGSVVELVVVDDAVTFGNSPYYGRVTAGILQELAGGEAQLRVHVVEKPSAATRLAQIAESVSVGVILINVAPALAATFYARCDRVVSMGPSAPGVPFVDMENADGAYAAVVHMRETGRGRIAALHGQQGNPCADARRAGYERAVRDLGLADISAIGKLRREAGYELTVRLLDENPGVDGLFVACDLMATGAMQALADLGRQVPRDVAVVGFDDSVIAACTVPPLSSVHQPVEAMAAAATRALLNREADRHWRRVFPAVLQLRRSSAGNTGKALLPPAR